MTIKKATRKDSWLGMNWIRQEKRLALYLRDGLACLYCGKGIEQDAKLSLDHVIPYNKGGKNTANNLITSCVSCNSSRQDTDLDVYVARIHKSKKAACRMLALIAEHLAKPIDVKAAKAIIAKRGSCLEAVKAAA